MAQLAATADENTEQVGALTHKLTDPLAAKKTLEHFADLSMRMAQQQEQFGSLVQTVARTAIHEQEHRSLLSQTATNQVAIRQKLEELLDSMAQQSQLEGLTQHVANVEQIETLNATLTKLSRTQFKSNTLSESKENQVVDALDTLREIVNRREEATAKRELVSRQRQEELRKAARGELAADLLPALDGLELAIENGRKLSARLLQEQQAGRHQRKEKIVNALRKMLQPSDATMWGKVRYAFTGESESDKALHNRLLNATIDEIQTVDVTTVPENLQAVESWLQGLGLVRDRFNKLLAAENVQPIEAQGQLFDPRLHVAVDSQESKDLPPDTIISVARKGYRQNQRVLRYAEVVVSRTGEAGSNDQPTKNHIENEQTANEDG